MSVFEVFGALLTAVAALGFINHKLVRLPDSVGITATGMVASLLLTVAGSQVPALSQWAQTLVGQIDFSEVIFHGLLGTLLFAGSLHVNISDLARQKAAILALSTLGVLLSTAAVGLFTYYSMALAGVHLSMLHCLLFGALISPTDPIAVMGVLKRAGVPQSLEMKVCGESLFNDGTAVVMFMLLLAMANGSTAPEPLLVAGMLLREIVGAAFLGLALGYGVYRMLRAIDSFAVEMLITLAVATAGYALAEKLHVSAPLTVVVAGLVVGNYIQRDPRLAKTREHLFQFWELLDELLNLVLYGLIGVQLIALAQQPSLSQWAVAALFIPVVLLARLFSVSVPLRLLRPLATVSPSAPLVLTWGGLRGGISIALALSLPPFAGRDLLVMGTYAVVMFSLLVQAPTLSVLLRRLGLGKAGQTP